MSCRTQIGNEVLSSVRAGLSGEMELLWMAEFFQGFSDPTRLKIINGLLLSELCVGDLSDLLGMSPPAISHHLFHLKRLRLVGSRREGRHVVYFLADSHIRQVFELCREHCAEGKGENP